MSMPTATTPSSGPGRAAPATMDARAALPLRVADFDAGLAALYHSALRGGPSRSILAALCQQLARQLRLRLAVLARRLDTGALAIEAASDENGLWLEFQRIPERWDGGVSSHGPAGEALRAQAPVRMQPDHDGFALWRSAAEAEHVGEILALPLAAADGARVLELCFDGPIAPGASRGTLTAGGLIRCLEDFFASLAMIEHNRLLASALASAGNAALITDLEGTIVWSNDAFSALTGYAADEVRGRNPNLLNSGHQGVRYYRDLWATIRAGRVWTGETVDRGKDGNAYTVRQTVSPVAQDGRVTHYLALQQDIERQKQERVQLERASPRIPGTGLLTASAFEDAARAALAEPGAPPMTLVVVSLRGAQRALPGLDPDDEQALVASVGRRIREAVAAPDLAGALGAFEYLLLLRDGGEAGPAARTRALAGALARPPAELDAVPDLDVHFGSARFPEEGATFQELWRRADRRLADEPYPPARRGSAH